MATPASATERCHRRRQVGRERFLHFPNSSLGRPSGSEMLARDIDSRHGLVCRVAACLLSEAFQSRGEPMAQTGHHRRDHHQARAQLKRALPVEMPKLLRQRRERIGGGLCSAAIRHDRAPAQVRRRGGPSRQPGTRPNRSPQMLLGRLKPHRGHLVPTELSENLASLGLHRRLAERSAQALRGRLRRAPASGARSGRTKRPNPPRVPGRPGQEQVRRHALGRGAISGQGIGRGGVSCLALARSQILVQRGPHNRVTKRQTLCLNEDVRPDEIIGRRARHDLAHPRDASGQRELTVVAEYCDRARQLGR